MPTLGGQNLFGGKGPADLRKIESRPDVLVFTTDVLKEPVEVTGRIRAELAISSDCPDTDFAALLTDVYPDGRSMLVTDGILRARFRKSFEKEEFLKPGETSELTVDLWSTSLVFNKGHRIRVLITSSNSPRFDPNPNTGHEFRADKTRRGEQHDPPVARARLEDRAADPRRIDAERIESPRGGSARRISEHEIWVALAARPPVVFVIAKSCVVGPCPWWTSRYATRSDTSQPRGERPVQRRLGDGMADLAKEIEKLLMDWPQVLF